MTDLDKLREVIQLGIERGWSFGGLNAFDSYSAYPEPTSLSVTVFSIKTAPTTNDILFNHDFARAYFGEEPLRAYRWHLSIKRKDENLIESGGKNNWQYHLQQLVLFPTDSERINYYYHNRGEK
jgi:hypothetical protein